MQKYQTYSPKELATIRAAIVNVAAHNQPKREPPHKWPDPTKFFATIEDDKLIKKIVGDERFQQLYYYMFFPIMDSNHSRELGKLEAGIIRLAARGFGASINSDGDNGYIIKPVQTPGEYAIAEWAANNDIIRGPRQYNTLEHFLTEERIRGEPFDWLIDSMDNDDARKLGETVGLMLIELYNNRVLYNERIFECTRHSHLILGSGSARLIDFGSAINLSRFNDLGYSSISELLVSVPTDALPRMFENVGSEPSRKDIENMQRMLRAMGVNEGFGRISLYNFAIAFDDLENLVAKRNPNAAKIILNCLKEVYDMLVSRHYKD